MPKTGTLPRSAATVSRAPTTAAGSPGPLVRKMPSGWSASASAAVVRLGTTVIRHPDSASSRSMARFRPQS